MKNMTKDTAMPARIIRSQTYAESGDKNANKLTAFSGALTKSTLIPTNTKRIMLKLNLMTHYSNELL